MEEVVTDSHVPIETEHYLKIMQGYSEVDMGSPVFYSIMVEVILKRGLDDLEPNQIIQIAKCLSKATNVQKAGFGYYPAMETNFKNGLH